MFFKIDLKDLVELDKDGFISRIIEMDDNELHLLREDINYEMIEAKKEHFKELDKRLNLLENEIIERELSTEEMEMMRELYF